MAIERFEDIEAHNGRQSAVVSLESRDDDQNREV